MKILNYRGKGEHSVNELEVIIGQQAEELHLLKSGQKQLYTDYNISTTTQLICTTCDSKDLCASCMRMPIHTIQDKIKNNCT